MTLIIRGLLLGLTLAVLLSLSPHADPRLTAMAAAPSAANGLEPLPGGCGGGLPPGDSVPACCMFGYVIIDGQPVAGAKVTVTSNQGRVEYVTDYRLTPNQPAYRINLSAAPLSVQRGDTITVKAEYSGHTQTITHMVLGGGQQVDVVLPRNQNDDYVFARQIWQPGQPLTFAFPRGIAVDGAGTIYVVDTENMRVQVFNKSGQFLLQWGTPGDGPGQFFRPSGIAADRLGFIYVTDTFRVQKFTNTGGWVATWGSSQSNMNGQFYGPTALAVDDNSDTVYVADSNNNRIQKFTSAGEFLTTWGISGTLNGDFRLPTGVAVDHDGFVYVADSGNNRIQKFTSTGSYVTQWGNRGNGNGQFYGFDALTLAVDGTNNVYVADTGNHRIQKFTNQGTWLDTWGGPDAGSGTDSDAHKNGQLAYPRGIAADKNGVVYVSDQYNHRIKTLTSTGTVLHTWGSKSNNAGQFSSPWGIALDGKGHIYVADTGNGLVQRLTTDGTWEKSWAGSGGEAGKFGFVRGVAVDSQGHVFVTDAGSGRERVQKFDSDGNPLGMWGTSGNGNSQFSDPIGIAVDASGNVYVADAGNNRIQKFDNNGTFLGVWGSLGVQDGRFNRPNGVGVDGNGDVYVADTNNNRIQKFTNTGVWLATWDQIGPGKGGFIAPAAIAFDTHGYIYITDQHRVHKFTSSRDWLATWSSYGNSIGLLSGPSAVAVDAQGQVYVSDQGNHRIEIFRSMTYTKPIATIVAVDPPPITQGQIVEMSGRGGTSMPNGLIASYVWTLDLNTTPFAITDNAQLNTGGLASGLHTIKFQVRDGTGVDSDPQHITIDITDPTSQPPGETWTFMLYLDGDTGGDIASFLNIDSPSGVLYRLKQAQLNSNVKVVALYDGPGKTGSFYYTFKPNGAFTQEAIQEKNMGDPQTLVDFVNWGKREAAADHYYLAIADHANGIDGIAQDASSSPADLITNGELRGALQTITENGAHPIDILHLDGCLMGLVENIYQVRGLAGYVISSENLDWSAFAYDSYQQYVGAHTTPEQLAVAIADKYAQIVGRYGYPYTIAALDIHQVDNVERAVKVLSSELLRFALASSTNRDLLVSIRNQAQKLDSDNPHPAITNDDQYVDLAHWASLVQTQVKNDNAITNAAGAVRSVLIPLVKREHHASGSYSGTVVNLEQVRGVAIYYPPLAGAETYQGYIQGDLTFPVDAGWGAFISGGLAALPFDPTPSQANPIAPLALRSRVYLPLIRR